MSVRTVAEKFMELCNKGKHFEFMHTMYAADIVSVEGDGKETGGKQATHEEVGLYTVKNDAVTREEFFYEGAFI